MFSYGEKNHRNSRWVEYCDIKKRSCGENGRNASDLKSDTLEENVVGSTPTRITKLNWPSGVMAATPV